MTEPNRQSGENEERIIEIEIERLRPFKEHPFQVKDDKEMFLLQESIEKYGILNPLIVRPVPDLPYQEARQQNVSITVENYRLVSIHEMQENEKVADIWKRTKNQCEVSDVLVLNKNGEISCYYVDENYPQYLAGFIRINTSGALITMETENYQIDGKKGNWIATDTIIIDGKQFYLMEHQVYRDQAQGVILDAYGKMVVEECKKFDEKTKQKIHDYIQQQVPLNPVEQLKQDGKIRLEHYQKFYQNGTYERSRESGTEANYDMVDGLVNNQKKNPGKDL